MARSDEASQIATVRTYLKLVLGGSLLVLSSACSAIVSFDEPADAQIEDASADGDTLDGATDGATDGDIDGSKDASIVVSMDGAIESDGSEPTDAALDDANDGEIDIDAIAASDAESQDGASAPDAAHEDAAMDAERDAESDAQEDANVVVIADDMSTTETPDSAVEGDASTEQDDAATGEVDATIVEQGDASLDELDATTVDEADASTSEADANVDSGVVLPPLTFNPNLPTMAALSHTCVILGGGRLKCWGDNTYGQLGIGDLLPRGAAATEMGDSLPYVDLGTNAEVVSVSVGQTHTCALLRTGAIKCWGEGGRSGLGSGAIGDELSEMGDALPAVDLGSGRRAIAVSAGVYHSCAIIENGEVLCWGENNYGEAGVLSADGMIGDGFGEMGDALTPVDLGSGRTATAISCGAATTCALLDDETVKCWGYGYAGMLGQGDQIDRGRTGMGDALPPIELGTGRSAKALSAANEFHCALLDDDTLRCWGMNFAGQLGIESTNTIGDEPGEMGDALVETNVGSVHTARIDSGTSHSCVVLTNGRVKCWGYGIVGAFGYGDTMNRGDVPGSMGDNLPVVPLGTGVTVTEIATGSGHSCARVSSGGIKCWGFNSTGVLGLGMVLDRGTAPGTMGDSLPWVQLTGIACDDGIDNDGDGLADEDDPGCENDADPSEWSAAACDDGVDNDSDGVLDLDDEDCVDGADVTEEYRAACNDGYDNDGDGELDANDSGCDDANDTSELSATICDNGSDDDHDGLSDTNDPGCENNEDQDERGTNACDNGSDDDQDGLSDYATDDSGDPGCASPADDAETDENNPCDDGIDNDHDGSTDWRNGSGDLGCASIDDATEYFGACDDGVDNDGDGATDTSDSGCADYLDTSERDAALVCDDGVDNDDDGKTDFAADGTSGDPGCESTSDMTETNAGLVCDDGVDNDSDGVTDADDPGCTSYDDTDEMNADVACDDGLDNDEDGLLDYHDPGCASPADNSELGTTQCDDGIDNDDDSYVDFHNQSGNWDNGCASPADNNESTACTDGLDNDGDGLTDLNDTGCEEAADDSERTVNYACDDGLDNDGDGETDYLPDGSADVGCSSPNDNEETDYALLEVEAGYRRSCALFTDGRVKCWGWNPWGQAGVPADGDTIIGTTPSELGDGLDYVDLGSEKAATVGVATMNTCVSTRDGEMYCWGQDNPNTNRYTPRLIDTGTALVEEVIAGYWDFCVRFDNGRIKCMGGDALAVGSADNGSGFALYTPGGNAQPYVDLGTGRTVAQLVKGETHSCALLDNQRVKCWGANGSGQLGYGDTTDRGDAPGEMGDALPYVDLGTGRTVRSLSAGRLHTCAILDNDQVVCWGTGYAGELGRGVSTENIGDDAGEMGDALIPVALGTGRTATALAGGEYNTCAVLDDATVKCWGWAYTCVNANAAKLAIGDGPGEMGDALPTIDLTDPYARSAAVRAIGMSYEHVCVVQEGGVRCWGVNMQGQLGSGTTLDLPQCIGDSPSELGINLPFVDFGSHWN